MWTEAIHRQHSDSSTDLAVLSTLLVYILVKLSNHYSLQKKTRDPIVTNVRMVPETFFVK